MNVIFSKRGEQSLFVHIHVYVENELRIYSVYGIHITALKNGLTFIICMNKKKLYKSYVCVYDKSVHDRLMFLKQMIRVISIILRQLNIDRKMSLLCKLSTPQCQTSIATIILL